jgi:hypothetical protein
MLVTLNCSFGDNVAGETVNLKKEQAQGLIDSGFAHEVSEDTKVTSDSKAVVALQAVRKELQEAQEALALAVAERDALLATQGVTDGENGQAGK